MSLNLDLLKEILTPPTAPYRERHVMAVLEKILKENRVPYFYDPIGNIVVGAKSKAEYLKILKTKSKEPVRFAIAHMDHPGFHGVEYLEGDRLKFKWYGGSATAELAGRKVWLADREGEIGTGEVESFELLAHGRAIDTAIVKMHSLSRKPKQAASLFGGFAFRAPHWQEGDLLYTRVADDLVGVYAIVQAAIEAWGPAPKGKKKKKAPPFIGLLSRAEETGFIGTIGHLELGWWKSAKRELVCLSLETSRTLPGALIGKGPIVRLGDRMNVFHAGYTRLFSDIALKILPEKHQRRVMDGGVCEGSAATSYGIPTIAISIPLGNYHNQSLEGGPDAGPPNSSAPEFVSISDVEGMLALIRAVLEPGLPWEKPYAKKVGELKTSFKKAKPLLSQGMKI